MKELNSVSVSISVSEILYYGFKGNLFDNPQACAVIFAPGRSLITNIIQATDVVIGKETRRKHFFAVSEVALANTVSWKALQKTPASVHNERRQWYIALHQKMMETLKAGTLGKALEVDGLRTIIDNVIDSQNLALAAYAGVLPEELSKLKEAKNFVDIRVEVVIPEDAI